ncbi:MAG: single-stranded-DNA-specific exonuclease RecJ [Planctomycetes bacterium]|nr:single-stranded-DNA-specific exonuclease RecJ [Planctomycetota bacterium]
MSKDWIVSPPWPDRDKAAVLWQVSPLVAQVLYNRGLRLGDDAAKFLSPKMSDLFPPDQLPGAPKAAERIVESVRRKDKIVLYGDYDVDGMTGVAILWHLLRLAGADVGFYVPHRLDEGYGLNRAALQSLVEDGAKLIISVDCGVTATAEVEGVRAAGAELIITDHHEPGDAALNDVLIVHPAVGGRYPNEHLCGAGVAFKLAWQIARVLSGADRVDDKYRMYLRDALVFAALGTIADVVPLVGENRIIARHGLALLSSTPFVGLRVLIECSGLTGNRVSSYDVGFKLAPRLNAAGRMGHARLGIELLTRVDESRAREIALYLEDQNRARQTLERRISKQAHELVERNEMDSDACRAIVLAQEGWHRGVIGIVAARLVDRYHRPVVLIALDKDGGGVGSARSITHFDMRWALSRCDEHLREFGGHAMAAGLKIQSASIPAFTEAFTALANNTLTGADLREKIRLDAEVTLKSLEMAEVEALNTLGPFGMGNPRPVLGTDWVELAAEPRCVGKGGAHLQATFVEEGAVLKAIAFGRASVIESLKEHRRCKLAFEPIVNEYNGQRTVEMQVLDFRFPT